MGKKSKNVDEFQYSGVTLDQTLKKKKKKKNHVKKLSNTLKFDLRNYRHTRNFFTVEASHTYFMLGSVISKI